MISEACTIEKGFTPSSAKAFNERTRLEGSGSALSSVLARLRTSNDVSVSLASSSLDSRNSGVCLLRLVRNGVIDRDFDGSCSGTFEAGLLPESRVFVALSRGGIRDGCDVDVGFDAGTGRVWTTLRIWGFWACSEKDPPFWRWSKNPMEQELAAGDGSGGELQGKNRVGKWTKECQKKNR